MGCVQSETWIVDAGEVGGISAAGAVLAVSSTGLVDGLPTVELADGTLGAQPYVVGVSLKAAAALASILLLTRGVGLVELETGLVPNEGQTIWLSTTTAGVGTTTQPSPLTAAIGVVVNAAIYASPASPFVLAFVNPENQANALTP